MQIGNHPILLGTTNKKKVVELNPHLGPLGLKLVNLADMPAVEAVDETGTTFTENARIKAIAYAKHFGLWTIGEDSGLCVPSLDNAPGIYSARFSGPDANDESNNKLLLEKLKGKKGEDREAYYVSAMALANPSGEIVIDSRGECWGRILEQRRGTSGFGYDPLFEIPEYHRTFGEMGMAVKNALSHRSRAIQVFIRALRGLL